MSIRIWDVPYAYGPIYAYGAEHKQQVNFGLAIDYTDYTCVVTTEASYVQLPVGFSHNQ